MDIVRLRRGFPLSKSQTVIPRMRRLKTGDVWLNQWLHWNLLPPADYCDWPVSSIFHLFIHDLAADHLDSPRLLEWKEKPTLQP
jgi:hypothetical protein